MQRRLVAAALVLFAAAACRTDPMSPGAMSGSGASARLVSPASAVDVDPSAPLTFEFDHAMMRGTTMDVVLHEGDVRGPFVPVVVTWSADRRNVTVTPPTALKSRTTYTAQFRCAGMMQGGGMSGMMGSSAGMGAMHGGASSGGGMAVTFTTR